MKRVLSLVLEWLKKRDIFSLGFVMPALYIIMFFGVPLAVVLGIQTRLDIPNDTLSFGALWILTLGLAGLFAGYRIPLGRFIAEKLPTLKKSIDFHRIGYVVWVIFGMGIVSKAARIVGGGYSHIELSPSFAASPFYSLVGYLDWFGVLAASIAAAVYYSLPSGDDRRRHWGWWAAIFFITEILYAIPTCSRWRVIVPIVVWFVVRSYFVRIKWQWIVAIALFSAALFPFGNACRSIGTRETYMRALFAQRNETQFTFFQFFGESIVSRINYYELFTKIVDADLPPENGRTLKDFIVSVGPPRFLWKSKPTTSVDGNKFGHQIGILKPSDTITSVGATHPGDWYVNFGIWGVFFGMALFGALWRFIYEYFIVATARAPAAVAIYSLLLLQIAKGLESNIAPVYAGITKFLVFFLVVHYLITKKDRNA